MSRNSLRTRCRAARPARSWPLILGVSILLVAACAAPTPPAVVIPSAGHGPGGGQFIVQCHGPVQSAAFDPIVFPGQAVAGHNHEFYGNQTINPSSTFASLENKSTSCDDPGDTASYWHPTVYSNGVRQVSLKSTLYYNSPFSGPVHSFPAGLKMMAGNKMATSPQDTNVVYWGCGNGSSVSKVNSPPQCHGGNLTFHVIFPNCWDGVHLDSPDHMSHVVYGTSACPPSHPVAIPQLTIRIQYTGWAPNPSSLTLSSGSINSMHADFFQAWNVDKIAKTVAGCINTGIKCSAAQAIGM